MAQPTNLPGTIFRKVQPQPFSPPMWLPVGNFAQGIQGPAGSPGPAGVQGPQGVAGPNGVSQVVYVNVKDFGAMGDGITDDTVAIQSAISSAANLVMWFPPGTYLCSTLIVMAGNFVTLSAVSGAVVLKKNAGSTPSIMRITGNYCTIQDIQFDGSSVASGNSCLEITGTFNKILRCFMSNATGHGIDLDGSLGLGSASNNWIEDCYIHNNTGIGISQYTATDNTIVNNQIYFNGDEGVTVDIASYRCKIIGNWIVQNCQSGGAGNISLDQGDLCIIQGNHILGAAGSTHGIVTNNNIGATNYCIISGNQIIDSGGKGIYLKAGTSGNASFNTVTGNVVRGSGSNSILMDTGCNSNAIVANSLNGVSVSDGGSSNSVANNT